MGRSLEKNIMKLLIITQKVDKNDSNLGFFHEWLKEFSKNVEKLSVICLEKGEYDLPKVNVYSLGKEHGVSRVGRLFNFYRYVFSLSGDYGTVFVHMNPIYLILAGWHWRLSGKKIGLWYTHKSVDLKLRLGVLFAHHIFTASPESFRLASKKLHVTGHGIDTNLFSPQGEQKSQGPFSLITVGRISPTKNINYIINALQKLIQDGIDAHLTIVGTPITQSDRVYEEKLKKTIAEKNLIQKVTFLGAIPHQELPRYYKDADVFINMSNTGSIDKSVLEAGSMNIPVITSNVAFKDMKSEWGFIQSKDDLSLSLTRLIDAKKEEKKVFLRESVIEKHSLQTLIPRILNFYE
jgi:glycosyltransferase involved in cell wall biosynthesis